MAKWYYYKKGIEYNETFAPVIKQQAFKLFLANSVNGDAEVHHIDITSAFLNFQIDEEIYIDSPEGLNQKFKHNQVLKIEQSFIRIKTSTASLE